MAIAKNILEFFPGMNRYLGLMQAASGAEEFVDAVSDYLASWSKRKIENLQKVDGGWSPFDRNGQPTRFRTVADITWMGDTVRRQLVALKEAGIAPNPELVELDMFFSAAKQVVDHRLAVRSPEDSTASRRGANPERAEGGTRKRES